MTQTRLLVSDLLGPELRTDGDRGPDHALIVLRVDDLAAYTAEVTERGGHVLAGPTPQSCWLVVDSRHTW